jgi:hypothetical protein
MRTILTNEDPIREAVDSDFSTENGLHREAVAQARALVDARYPLDGACATVLQSIAMVENARADNHPFVTVTVTLPQCEERNAYTISVRVVELHPTSMSLLVTLSVYTHPSNPLSLHLRAPQGLREAHNSAAAADQEQLFKLGETLGLNLKSCSPYLDLYARLGLQIYSATFCATDVR